MRSVSSIFLQKASFRNPSLAIRGIAAQNKAYSVQMVTDNGTHGWLDESCSDDEETSYCSYKVKEGHFFLFSMNYVETPILHKHSPRISVSFDMYYFAWAQVLFVRSEIETSSENKLNIPCSGNPLNLRDITIDDNSFLKIQRINSNRSCSAVTLTIQGYSNGEQHLLWNTTLGCTDRSGLLVAIFSSIQYMYFEHLVQDSCSNITLIYEWVFMKLHQMNISSDPAIT